MIKSSTSERESNMEEEEKEKLPRGLAIFLFCFSGFMHAMRALFIYIEEALRTYSSSIGDGCIHLRSQKCWSGGKAQEICFRHRDITHMLTDCQ